MLHVVLYEPEIPANTGNIMRTCQASNCKLHIIQPIGFLLDEKHLKRAGMDYRDKLDFTLYDNWEDFLSKNKGSMYYITRYGKKAPSAFDYTLDTEDIYLVFGKESTGIPKELLRQHLDRCARLPMVADARSLNLSNCVAICVYEVLRQLDYPGLSGVEVIKGDNWLES